LQDRELVDELLRKMPFHSRVSVKNAGSSAGWVDNHKIKFSLKA
jgi:hypothetical protein